MTKQIVVTGATGTIGRCVVERLVAAQVPVTALVHSPAKRAALDAIDATTAVGSFEDASSLAAAFAGADTAVLITASNARAAEQALAAIEAAKRAGVRKLVRISALRAGFDGPTDNTRQHARTEAAIAASGLAYVILRPQYFFQNLFASMSTIVDQGRIYWGVGAGRIGMVDTRDVSDAAVVAATTGAFDGRTFELTGPATLDYHEVAAAIGRALGRTVTYIPIPAEAAAEGLRAYGADAWTVGIVRDYCTAYGRGFGAFTTDHVREITGRAPRSVDDFVREVLAPAANAT